MSAAATAARRAPAQGPPPPLVLLVDNGEKRAAKLRTLLEGAGCRVAGVGSAEGLPGRLRQDPAPAIVLLGMEGSGAASLEILKKLRRSSRGAKVVMLTSGVDPRMVVRAVQLGAADCLEFGDDSAILALVSEHSRTQAGDDGAVAEEEIGNGAVFVAASKAMKRLRSLIAEVAPTEVPVLCLGESGTGKEVMARLLHKHSRRRSQPFLKVNCAALPGELLESELFGYEPGAFTGAVRAKPGKFELCDKGTILLDEIGEVPAQLQAKLLHVLQDGEFSRLGGRSRVKVDVRIVAATNIDIPQALASKRLREDLYYRLNTVVLEIPPLRQRREDIPILLRHFVERHGGHDGLPVRPFSTVVLEFALRHHWPGNVRELENFAKRYLMLGERALNGDSFEKPPPAPEPARARALKPLASSVRREAETEAILRALEQTHWNRKEAARLLDISYKTLLEKLRLYQIAKSNGHTA